MQQHNGDKKALQLDKKGNNKSMRSTKYTKQARENAKNKNNTNWRGVHIEQMQQLLSQETVYTVHGDIYSRGHHIQLQLRMLAIIHSIFTRRNFATQKK